MEQIVEKIRKFLERYNIQEDFELKVPARPEWGDLTTNLPAKIMGKYKIDISNELKEEIEKLEIVRKVEVVRGNLNIFLDWKKFGKKLIEDMCEKGIKYFAKNIGNEKTVVIDYFSVNIARLPHFGHLRSAIIGACLRNVLELMGFKVIGVNWWGDVGTQFGALIYAFKKWGNAEELKKRGLKYLMELYVKFHKELEKDRSLWEKAKEEYRKVEEGDEENLKLLEMFKEMTRERLKRTWYKWFNLKFDDERGESYFIEKAKKHAEDLLKKGIAFFGENGEIRVKLEDFGLGNPVFIKSDGTTTYFSRDFAAVVQHYEDYKFSKKIYVVSNEQTLHFKQLFKTLELAGYPFYKGLHHLKFGMILMKVGEKAKKMSTRRGRLVSAEEVIRRAKIKVKRIMWRNKKVPRERIDEEAWKVALGSIIFFILKYDPKRDIVFEWEKVLDFEGFSGPFVQYSVVRAKSILEKVGEIPKEVPEVEVNDYERNLLRTFLKASEVLMRVAKNYETNVLAEYSFNLSKAFNEFYEKCPVLGEKDEKRRIFRIKLVQAFAKVLGDILNLMNIRVPSKM